VLVELADTAAAGEAETGAIRATDMGLLRNKTAREITLQGDAEMSSTATAEDGALQRRIHLLADEMRYGLSPARLVVPGRGRMLYEDYRGSAAPVAGEAPRAAVGDARGATAFEWQRELVFDQDQQVATMSGDVVIAHRAVGEQEITFRLQAPLVRADLQQPPAAEDGPAARLSLHRLSAQDGVRFSARTVEFDADSLGYMPAEDLVIARGSERHPASLLDAQGFSRGSFEELRYNTATEHVEIRGPAGGFRPGG
jgi:hypothetical protein